jgi:putative acetyltransferase
MYRIVRTSSANDDFKNLVHDLDLDLRIRDGDEHAFYAQYNKIDSIKHVVIIYQNDEPVGCGAFKPYNAATVEIKRMFVPLKYRGAGIASLVLRELESWAVQLNYQKCILETGNKQPEAIRLYQKNNYSLIPNFGQYANAVNSLCFEKIIAVH